MKLCSHLLGSTEEREGERERGGKREREKERERDRERERERDRKCYYTLQHVSKKETGGQCHMERERKSKVRRRDRQRERSRKTTYNKDEYHTDTAQRLFIC